MATLKDIQLELEQSNKHLDSLDVHFKNVAAMEKAARGDKLEASREAKKARTGGPAQARVNTQGKSETVADKKKKGPGLGGALGLAMKGLGAAVGLTAIGAGIGGFMSGMAAAGDLTGFTGTVFAEQAHNIAKGFNALGSMNKVGIAMIGSLVAAGILLPVKKAAKAALGMSLMGAGFGGFMTGIVAASAIGEFAGFDASGAIFAAQAGNIAAGFNALGDMDEKALKIFGVLVAGTVGLSAIVSSKKAAVTAINMTIFGAGLGGFMTGIAAAGDLTGFEGDAFAAQGTNVAKGITALAGIEGPALLALPALLGAAAALSLMPSMGGMKTGAKFAVAASLLGAGVGGLIGGITLAPGLMEKMGGFDGGAFATMAQNIADGLGAFTGGQLGGLAALMGVGGILGAVPGGAALAASAATGMGLIGIGIGAFIGGIAVPAAGLDLFGIDGSAIKTLLSNVGEGLSALNDVKGDNLKDVGLGMGSIGLGMVALLGVDGLSKISGFISGTWNTIKGFFKDQGPKKNSITQLIEDLVEPLQDIDFGAWSAIDASGFDKNIGHIANGLNAWESTKPEFFRGLGSALAGFFFPGDKKPFDELIHLGEKSNDLKNAADGMERIAEAMGKLQALNLDRKNQFAFTDMAFDLANSTGYMAIAINGGKFNARGTKKQERTITVQKEHSLTSISQGAKGNLEGIGNLLTVLTGRDHSIEAMPSGGTEGFKALEGGGGGSASNSGIVVNDQSFSDQRAIRSTFNSFGIMERPQARDLEDWMRYGPPNLQHFY